VDSFERGKQRRHQGDLYQLRTSLQQIRYRKLRVPALGRVGSGRPGRTAWPWPYKTPKDLIEAAKTGGANSFKMGGTGSKQEDQIITAAIEQATGATFTYIPYKGGGDVAAQLVGNHITASVNNPIEAVAQWRAGALRPLCVFDSQRIDLKEPIANNMSWNDVPTCKESGLDVEYTMLRGIFTSPGVNADQIKYYVELFQKVRETPDWKDFMAKGAFNTTFMTGDEYKTWLAKAETTHKGLMEKAGFLAK
jgi:putative tricarboxylic transport membrane protein